MKIAIIKYNAGNIRSVLYALKRLGYDALVTDDINYIKTADKVIFPGVGEASSTMNHLQKNGFDKLLKSLTQPVLGICLGLQLMCSHSEENDTPCLDIFPVNVKLFPQTPKNLTGFPQPVRFANKVPHMGWNTIDDTQGPLFKDIPKGSYVYFVHSYYAGMSEFTSASCSYITKFSASLQKENFFATQFHPEKSGEIGQAILKNFITI